MRPNIQGFQSKADLLWVSRGLRRGRDAVSYTHLNYMLAEGEMGHITEQKERGRYSEKIKRDTAVVRNYKKALKKKKNLRPKSVFRSPVYIGCGFAAVSYTHLFLVLFGEPYIAWR